MVRQLYVRGMRRFSTTAVAEVLAFRMPFASDNKGMARLSGRECQVEMRRVIGLYCFLSPSIQTPTEDISIRPQF